MDYVASSSRKRKVLTTWLSSSVEFVIDYFSERFVYLIFLRLVLCIFQTSSSFLFVNLSQMLILLERIIFLFYRNKTWNEKNFNFKKFLCSDRLKTFDKKRTRYLVFIFLVKTIKFHLLLNFLLPYMYNLPILLLKVI